MTEFDGDLYKAEFTDRYWVYCDVTRVLLTLLEYIKIGAPELGNKHRQALVTGIIQLLPEVTYCLQQVEKDTRVVLKE